MPIMEYQEVAGSEESRAAVVTFVYSYFTPQRNVGAGPSWAGVGFPHNDTGRFKVGLQQILLVSNIQ